MLNNSFYSSPRCSAPPINSYGSVLTSVIVPVVFTIIILFGIFGNVMVLVVIISNKKMRNSTNILIASLAIADLTFIVFCVPFTGITYAMNGWPLGQLFCRIYQFSVYVTAYCSVYTLVLMCFDRFLAVVYPITSSNMRSDRNTFSAVILMWFLFICTNLPLYFHSDVVKGRKNEAVNCVVYYCTYLPMVQWNSTIDQYLENKVFSRKYFTCFFIFAYFLPLAVITILYGKLLRRLLYGRTSKMAQSSEAMKSKKRVTVMVVIVIVVFAACWFPIQCIFLLQNYGTNATGLIFRTIHVAGNCLAYANSMVNPILYAFLSENFRRSFEDVLCCQQQQSRIDYERTHMSHNRGGASSSFRNKLRRQSKNGENDVKYPMKVAEAAQVDKSKFENDRIQIEVFLETNLDA